MCEIILPMLNAVQLLLIDEDSSNRVSGLKIILKLTTDWEINDEWVRNTVISMGIHTQVLQMSE